jgi:lipooligosaccharide transport system ATP-binding protein
LLTEEGKTLILTTHYMEEAARLCDRLVIMEGGLIIAEGTPGALVEEHVSPQVLEFRTDRRSLEGLVPVLEAASDAVERTGDESILAYTDDADALLERVRASGTEIENTVYRQAGLEDVFLRLTGRRLVE